MEEMDPTPRFEIVQHIPLGKITPFRGKLDESENSMQWLRGFVYEMKGTHTSPNEWCMAFQLSLRDGAVHWHRALSRKTKRTWSLLSDKFISYYCSQFSQSASTRYYRAKRSKKEHIRDYLTPRNDYTRSSNFKFERSGREVKEHVKQFLETCGDRDLERQLTPMQLRDIHTLEDIVSDIQKVEKQVASRSSSQRSSRNDDRRHSSSSGCYGRHDSRSRSQERSRIEPRHTSRVALVDASVTEPFYTLLFLTMSGQVHDFGKCEAFGELAKILRTNVDKKNISPELQKLVFGCPPTETGLVPTGQPQSVDLVIDAECLYAFTGKCEWPEDNNNNDENEKKCGGVYLDGGTLHEIKEDTTTKPVVDDGWLVSICEASEVAPMHTKTMKLLPGERMGWWSSQRFDRRVRMRALVRGAVNDVRTLILLDTGANVGITTTKLARRLRLESIQEHGRQLEVQGIQEGKMSLE
ncbi:LOW QUALITY PROTEIN: hypothetical protein PHMEG_00030850 [Phytophthora megakarya]|uniref:Eukaryotic/viral aspartic protease n=1 Tax=Phytophthora megakarya TaxID=4795 RepID=A0A225V043_9STRA|nr:LOW QUALITY PROTEIN: hypothetical protein PHMEG_00030850 [Phytophthora megakarya]